MLFCPNCGTPMEDGTKFCPDCGTPIGGFAPTQPAPVRKDVAAMVFSIVSLVSGVTAMICALIPFYGFVGAILAIPGLIFSSLTRKRSGANDGDRGRAKAGKILSIIALIVGIFVTILSVVVLVLLIVNGDPGSFNPSTDFFPFT